jgi:hypothetical protein
MAMLVLERVLTGRITQKFLGTCPGCPCEVWSYVCGCWWLYDIACLNHLLYSVARVNWQYHAGVDLFFWQCGTTLEFPTPSFFCLGICK